MEKKFQTITRVLLLFLLLISILIGCKGHKPAEQLEDSVREQNEPSNDITAEESQVNGIPADSPEQNGNENTDPTHEEVLDYSQMSNEEIIGAFMKAWEEQNTEVMDELSNFSKLCSGDDWERYGYNFMFCWGGSDVAMGLAEYNYERPVCTHGCENFSHDIYNLEIRQSDYYDYGEAPEDLPSVYKHFQDVYEVKFNYDEDCVINHLELCVCGFKGIIQDESSEYGKAIYFRIRYDEEKGHRVIANKGWVADNLGR